jgi:type IV secretory pathway TraG/TraD family ATPase VirD4
MNNEVPNQTADITVLAFLGALIVTPILIDVISQIPLRIIHILLCIVGILSILAIDYALRTKSKNGRELTKQKKRLKDVPRQLLDEAKTSIVLGHERDLKKTIYLPDAIRSRHVHILGSTGSGKTESVILNFLRQDVTRGFGAIILDAKGDLSFLDSLKKWVPEEKLKVFDLSSTESLTYNPLLLGSPAESAQRLFASLTWSEVYYKSKAFSALQLIFAEYFKAKSKNPRLSDVNHYLYDTEVFNELIRNDKTAREWSEKEFTELSGLKDQVRSLCTDHLATILSPEGAGDMDFQDTYTGIVLYFRLQSLMSPQLVTTIGRLVINHLNYLTGAAHRGDGQANKVKLIPTYLDEFASFACPEFADLISKARSAGLALHFAHQSIGDLTEVSPGFINRITDNSATKIVMRINDPDTAEYFSRAFGTHLYQKITQRVTNAKETADAEIVGEGTVREAHQFRAPPDLFKTLTTGVGSVLIAHGYENASGASSVFRVKFPELKGLAKG